MSMFLTKAERSSIELWKEGCVGNYWDELDREQQRLKSLHSYSFSKGWEKSEQSDFLEKFNLFGGLMASGKPPNIDAYAAMLIELLQENGFTGKGGVAVLDEMLRTQKRMPSISEAQNIVLDLSSTFRKADRTVSLHMEEIREFSLKAKKLWSEHDLETCLQPYLGSKPWETFEKAWFVIFGEPPFAEFNYESMSKHKGTFDMFAEVFIGGLTGQPPSGWPLVPMQTLVAISQCPDENGPVWDALFDAAEQRPEVPLQEDKRRLTGGPLPDIRVCDIRNIIDGKVLEGKGVTCCYDVAGIIREVLIWASGDTLDHYRNVPPVRADNLLETWQTSKSAAD